MQTTCLHCGSVFRITDQQLEIARGQVRCNQCMQVFNALLTLENYTGQVTEAEQLDSAAAIADLIQTPTESTQGVEPENSSSAVSLNQAMYGEDHKTSNPLKSIWWGLGIMLLLILIVVQIVYYQRYQLIASNEFQQPILNLCGVLPCDENRFINLEQIRLVERNVFTHPTQDNALMVTGSLVNEASFAQTIPKLKISLSDLQGNLIANRVFEPEEYLNAKSVAMLKPGKPVQFRLEIIDPGEQALTYEFEFTS